MIFRINQPGKYVFTGGVDNLSSRTEIFNWPQRSNFSILHTDRDALNTFPRNYLSSLNKQIQVRICHECPPSAAASQESVRNLSFHDLPIFPLHREKRLDPVDVSHFQSLGRG